QAAGPKPQPPHSACRNSRVTEGIGTPTSLKHSQIRSMPVSNTNSEHNHGVTRAQESRSWLPTFFRTSARPWQFWTIARSWRRKTRKEGLKAPRILLNVGSHVKIVLFLLQFALRTGRGILHCL